MKLSVLIPVYNEKKTLLTLLKRVNDVTLSQPNGEEIEKEIIIIDDFSTDGSRQIIRNLEGKQYKKLYHSVNLGKGKAIRTGLEYASGDIILIQDADLEYDPNDYNILIKPIIESKAKVVYGSRRLNKKDVSYSRLSFYLGGIGLTMITNTLYPGLNLTDEATCYKAFQTDVIKDINLKCKGFEFCPEVTAKLAKKRINIHEVPISYTPRSTKEGKKINWRDGIKAFFYLFKYRFVD